MTYDDFSKAMWLDPNTGKLWWHFNRPLDHFANQQACNSWHTRFAGREVKLHLYPNGYQKVKCFGKDWLAHRVIWLLYTTQWPEGQIDHIDGIRTNNIVSNLRDVTSSENNKNSRLRSDNQSGVVGVSKRNDYWVATIQGQHLGTFRFYHDAVRSRKAAEAERGFSDRHGETK